MFFKKNSKKEIINTEKNLLSEFEKIKHAILPIPRPDYTVIQQEGGENRVLNKLYKENFGDMTLFFQIDRGDFWEVMIKENLPESISVDDVFSIALSNLYARYKCEIILSHHFLGYEVLSEDTNFTASVLYLGNLWINLANRLNDNLIIALPARDTVLIVEESKKDTIDEMREVVKTIYTDSGKFQLSQMLYKFDLEDKTFSVYE